MSILFCVAVTLPDCDGTGWAEPFMDGFYLSREPVYMSKEEAETVRTIVREKVPGTVIEIVAKRP